MTITLVKGENVSLTKAAPGLSTVTVGLGWDQRNTNGDAFDLDASAIALNTGGSALSDKHFVYFNNQATPDGSIKHNGDNTSGEGEGDDEQIEVNLSAVAGDVDRIVFPVSIYDAAKRNQAFGQVRNAFIRVVDAANGSEITRFDLSEDASTETAMIFGELYRNGSEWKFRAVGQGYSSGLAGIAEDYGISVG